MKTRCLIGIAVLLLAACARPDDNPVETRRATSLPPTTASPELSAIDSLIWRQPDSALAVLMDYLSDDGRDGVHTVSTNETFDNHYTQLLVSELLYKNDYEQTNRRDLQKAVTYFDSLVCGTPPSKGGGGIKKELSHPTNLAFLDARSHYINGVGYYENDSVVEA